MSTYADIVARQFCGVSTDEVYAFQTALKELHTGKNTLHLSVVDSNFRLSRFLQAEGIEVQIEANPRIELISSPSRSATTDKSPNATTLASNLLTGCMSFRYKETDFKVYKATWNSMRQVMYVLVFDDSEDVVKDVKENGAMSSAGHVLIQSVHDWTHALKDEMWVFQEGGWSKNRDLWSAIQSSSWDDLVLEHEFLEGLRRDTRTFFESREIYEDLGVTWKRGLLLLGPPGNGKTESIKVLLKESGQTALYVKSFTTQRGSEAGVKAIFDHARSHAPCILVIEDLDSLVESSVRSFFLNELDGLAKNEGILTIATTNHPEKIDDAILNRPSRFDVKYDFGLPTESLRITYARKWLRKVAASKRRVSVQFELSEDDLAKAVAERTKDWSFAFLKELFVSFLLRVAHDRARALAQGGSLTEPAQSSDSILFNQIEKLSAQIMSAGKQPAGKEDEATPSVGPPAPMRGGYAPRKMLGAPQMRVARPSHPGQNF